MSDATLRRGEGLILMLVIVAFVMRFALKRLQRSRPGFSIGRAVFVGVSLRFLGAVAVAATGLQTQLRGGDELTFLAYAKALTSAPLGTSYLPQGKIQLQTSIFAVQLKLADLSTMAMRVTQIGIAMLGVVLIVAAVYDVAGPRASRLAAWLLAIEPASLFFQAGLDKEPLMVLASGLVVFGGTKIWRRLDFTGLFVSGLGGLIAVETRSYAGWFLVSATVLILLHSALRRLKSADNPMRAMSVVYAVVVLGFVATPTLLAVTSKSSLAKLQASQDYTTSAQAATTAGGSNSDNLALEQVNFSTRGEVIQNLPKRIFDITFKPYPWQLQDASQQLGALGSLIALGVLFLFVRYVWRQRGDVFAEIAPFFYPLMFLTVAYALSAGNAGTGFRYRTHLVVLAIASVVVLREHWLRAHAERPELAGVADPGIRDERLGPGLATA